MRLWLWGGALVGLAGLASWGGGQLVAQGARAALAGGPAEVRAVQPSGFPLAIGAQLDGLVLSDPALGAGVVFDSVQATAPLWAPLEWRARPALPAQATLFGQRFTLAGQGAEAGLKLGLAADLPVQGATLSLADARLTAQAASAPALAVQTLSFSATADGPRYAVQADLAALALPPGLSARFAPGANLPDVVESVTATGTVSFAQPVALSAATLPPPTEIDLAQARMLWGGREVLASGKLAVTTQGIAEGTIMLATKDWAAWLEVAQAAGLIGAERMPMLMGLAAYMAGQSGSGEVQVPLAFANGLMSLGPLPLGPAPRFAP